MLKGEKKTISIGSTQAFQNPLDMYNIPKCYCIAKGSSYHVHLCEVFFYAHIEGTGRTIEVSLYFYIANLNFYFVVY